MPNPRHHDGHGYDAQQRGQSPEPLESVERRRVLRLYSLALIGLVWMALLGLRLWDLQVRRGPDFAARAHQQQEDVIEIRAERGAIYDRRGSELALSSPVDSIAVFPQKVVDPARTASILSDVLRLDAKATYARLQDRGFQWIKRLAEPGEAARIRALKLEGLHFEKESKRYYPKGAVAAHLLGYVDIDHIGQGGLELRFDDILTGKPGARLVQYDALRQLYESRIVLPPTPGASLYLTIDESIQTVAEESLAKAAGETDARGGSIVVMDPQTGDVLALANWPSFDPNERPSGPRDMLLRDNYAIGHLYEPGSTFKLITVAAALEEGLTTPDEIIDCQNGAIYVGRRRIRDHKPHRLLTVSQVVALSSNVGAIKLGQRLGPVKLREYVTKFGFGDLTSIELPGETRGLVRPLQQWRDGSVASAAMGHEIGVTPLQMAQAASVIANGGYLVRPRIVAAVREPSGELRELERPAKERILSAETAAQLRAMMEQTVLTGTGKLAQTPGYRVGGKTGTAQLIDPETRTYSPDRYIASFVGVAPLNDPAMVAIIVLDSPVGGYYGGLVAAPAFPELAAQTLRFRDVPPTEPIKPRPQRREPVAAEFFADLAQPAEAAVRPGLWQAEDGAVLVSSADELQAAPLAPHDEPQDDAQPRDPARLRVTTMLTPNFLGKTVREAFAEGLALGLQIETSGAGVAIRQSPEPGAPLMNGGVVRVEFGRLVAAGPTGVSGRRGAE